MDDSHLISRLSESKRLLITTISKEHKKGVLSVSDDELRSLISGTPATLSRDLEELIGHFLLEQGDDDRLYSLTGAGIRISKKLEGDPKPSPVAPVELTSEDLEFFRRLSRAVKNFPAEVSASNLTQPEKEKLLSRAGEFFEHPAVLELLRRAAGVDR